MERDQHELEVYIDKLYDASDLEVIRILSKYLHELRQQEAEPDVA